jgi:hypothetical protein
VDSTYASSYFSDRAIAAWAGTEAAMEAALIRAGQFLNGLRWRGTKVNYEYTMCWPRFGVPIEDWTVTGHASGLPAWASYGMYWASNEVPYLVLYAQCEAALRYLVGTDMMPDLPRGGLTLREKVGPVDITYMASAPAGTTFQSVMAWIRPLLKSKNSIELVRG